MARNLARILALENESDKWEKIQSHIYKQQRKILKDLGEPTQVTPYAANTTGQAAISLWNVLEGRDPYSTLYPGIINYLSGMHGMVPDSVNKELVSKALDQKGLKKAVEYQSSTKRANMLKKADKLKFYEKLMYHNNLKKFKINDNTFDLVFSNSPYSANIYLFELLSIINIFISLAFISFKSIFLIFIKIEFFSFK